MYEWNRKSLNRFVVALVSHRVTLDIVIRNAYYVRTGFICVLHIIASITLMSNVHRPAPAAPRFIYIFQLF